MSQLGLNPKQVIFIDETWAKTNMTRLRGRCAIGDRLVEKVPHGHWKTTTLIAALDHAGIRCATTVDGAINAQVFEAFVGQVLVPTLRRGDVVVLDNLSSHKSASTREMIESVGATLLFLPPYSPDFNPIELAFAKLKQLLRSAAVRSMPLLWSQMQPMLDRISASDASHFIRHCGYTLEVE